jgi:hypothetical protein
MKLEVAAEPPLHESVVVIDVLQEHTLVWDLPHVEPVVDERDRRHVGKVRLR